MKLSDTKQRRILLHELASVKSHPTAADLFRMVRGHLPSISLGTVYRNLELMSDAGLIQKLEYPGRERRFDANVSSHPHLRCKKCGAVEDVEADPKLLPEIRKRLQPFIGSRMEECTLEITGLCACCAEPDTTTKGKRKT